MQRRHCSSSLFLLITIFYSSNLNLALSLFLLTTVLFLTIQKQHLSLFVLAYHYFYNSKTTFIIVFAHANLLFCYSWLSGEMKSWTPWSRQPSPAAALSLTYTSPSLGRREREAHSDLSRVFKRRREREAHSDLSRVFKRKREREVHSDLSRLFKGRREREAHSVCIAFLFWLCIVLNYYSIQYN